MSASNLEKLTYTELIHIPAWIDWKTTAKNPVKHTQIVYSLQKGFLHLLEEPGHKRTKDERVVGLPVVIRQPDVA